MGTQEEARPDNSRVPGGKRLVTGERKKRSERGEGTEKARKRGQLSNRCGEGREKGKESRAGLA